MQSARAQDKESGIIVTTTLYDLIASVGDQLSPNDEQLIPLIVGHVLETCGTDYRVFDGRHGEDEKRNETFNRDGLCIV